jgi:hypothetical protein
VSSRFYETIGAYTRLSGAWVRHRALPELKEPRTYGLAYLAIGFFMFGHVAAARYHAEQQDYASCRAKADAYTICWSPDVVLPVAAGLGAGFFWPLYLSWEIQQ